MITTNNTQPEEKKKEYSLKSKNDPRPKSTKSKVAGGERGVWKNRVEESTVRCKTTRSLSRRSYAK